MATGNTTESVMNHQSQALLSRNIDSLMEDYTRDSIVFTPMGTFKGLENIRAAYTSMMGMFTPEALANMKIIKQDIDGEYGYILWSAAPAIAFAADVYHVRKGKIVMISFVSQMG